MVNGKIMVIVKYFFNINLTEMILEKKHKSSSARMSKLIHQEIVLPLELMLILVLKFETAHLCFLSSIETDSIRYTGLEICNSVILRFNCRGLWRGGQLKSLGSKGMDIVRFKSSSCIYSNRTLYIFDYYV